MFNLGEQSDSSTKTSRVQDPDDPSTYPPPLSEIFGYYPISVRIPTDKDGTLVV